MLLPPLVVRRGFDLAGESGPSSPDFGDDFLAAAGCRLTSPHRQPRRARSAGRSSLFGPRQPTVVHVAHCSKNRSSARTSIDPCRIVFPEVSTPCRSPAAPPFAILMARFVLAPPHSRPGLKKKPRRYRGS